MEQLGPPVVPFYILFPENRLQEKGHPYSNLATGGPRTRSGGILNRMRCSFLCLAQPQPGKQTKDPSRQSKLTAGFASDAALPVQRYSRRCPTEARRCQRAPVGPDGAIEAPNCHRRLVEALWNPCGTLVVLKAALFLISTLIPTMSKIPSMVSQKQLLGAGILPCPISGLSFLHSGYFPLKLLGDFEQGKHSHQARSDLLVSMQCFALGFCHSEGMPLNFRGMPSKWQKPWFCF